MPPAISQTTDGSLKPLNYYILLFQGFQFLDQAGPLDVLSTLSKRQEGVDINVAFISEDKDPVGTAPRTPKGATWKFEDINELPRNPKNAIEMGSTGVNARIYIDYTMDEIIDSLSATNTVPAPEDSVDQSRRTFDVLIIPGGIGTRMYRIDNATGERTSNIAKHIAFVQRVVPYVRNSILTVCTGSDLLAQTGLLDGRRACTNDQAFSIVSKRSPAVHWLEKRRWARSLRSESKTENALDIWTSAGVSAGIDLMLWYVAHIYGMKVAQELSRRLEYEWRENVGEGEIDPHY